MNSELRTRLGTVDFVADQAGCYATQGSVFAVVCAFRLLFQPPPVSLPLTAPPPHRPPSLPPLAWNSTCTHHGCGSSCACLCACARMDRMLGIPVFVVAMVAVVRSWLARSSCWTNDGFTYSFTHHSRLFVAYRRTSRHTQVPVSLTLCL